MFSNRKALHTSTYIHIPQAMPNKEKPSAAYLLGPRKTNNRIIEWVDLIEIIHLHRSRIVLVFGRKKSFF
jgi:hypothetical protein